MRFHIILASVLTIGLSACATKAPATVFSPRDACSEKASTYDSRDVQCQFPTTKSARQFRLKANFSGGHDDTAARLDPFIDNAPLSCDEGSKTHLFAEDGDVSLWCVFSVAGDTRDSRIFKFTIRWSHAEYVNYEIVAQ